MLPMTALAQPDPAADALDGHALECAGAGWPPPLRWAPRSDALALGRPGAGEIRVRVEVASVNPIDVKRSRGYGRRLLAFKGAARWPMVLGNDVVGVVTEVGPRVRGFQPGDRVFGVKPPSRQGTHAGAVVLLARHALHAPVDAPAAALAVLPYSFVTMWLALRQAGIASTTLRGTRVLVHGASGALGLLALQVLVQAGAEVSAIAGRARAQALSEAGAAQVLDRDAVPWRTLQGGFDATLNFAAWEDELRLLRCLRPGARGHAGTVHPLLGHTDRHGLMPGLWRSWREFRRMRAQLPEGCGRYGWTVFAPDGEALKALASWMDRPPAQRLRLPVGLALPMDQAGAAFAHVASGRAGRAVLLSPAG